MKTIRIISIVFFIVILASCENPISIEEETYTPYLTKFSFFQNNNLELNQDYTYTIDSNTDTIRVYLPGVSELDSLCPTFEGKYKNIFVNEVEQISGESKPGFLHRVKYELVGLNPRDTSSIVVDVRGMNKIPRLFITTQDMAPIQSKDTYLSARFRLVNCPEFGIIEDDCQVRGRGNYTWREYPKKPYKIKFNKKQTPFGWPADKEWTLLADYCDKSLLRTAAMSIVSELVGLPFSIHYKHVELFINNEYQGVYVMTDVIERSENRIPISDTGFIIEDDEYYKEEPFFFTTDKYHYNYTFKYPKPNKGIYKEDDNFLYIQSFMNRMESALYDNSDEIESLINLRSFAKWFIATEIVGNYEPNFYYILPERGSSLEMWPMWDAEWSFGITCWDDTKRRFLSELNLDDIIWPSRKYFSKLFQYEPFVLAVKEEWSKFLCKTDSFNEKIKEITDELKDAQVYNFDKWDVLGKNVSVGLLHYDSWEEEVNHVISFYQNKKEVLGEYIQSM